MAGAGARVGVVGASGFGGAELLRLLARHPDVEVVIRAAAGSAGRTLGDLAPGFPPDLGGDAVLTAPDVTALGALDLVLLATPDEVSLELAPALLAAGTRVVDLSGAFRVSAAAYASWYGRPHTAPELAADGPRAAVYGLTEWAREAVASAALVANPGCYPTATLLGLRPLVALIEPEGVVISAVSGTSGAGRSTRRTCRPASSSVTSSRTARRPTGTPSRSRRTSVPGRPRSRSPPTWSPSRGGCW